MIPQALLSERSRKIKAEAARLGFDACGIAHAEFLEEEAPLLERWLREGRHGQMQWMENHFDKRLDPRLLVDGAKSVISLLLNYYPEEEQCAEAHYKFSKYAYGRDYHKVLKKKLAALLDFIQQEIGEVGGRAFVDSAPVMDKAWAKRAGLGWIGKNSNLLNRQMGSFFFVAELIVDIELEYDQPLAKDYCGSCNRCVEACPTQAIVQPGVVDGSRCISYLTIELKEQIPAGFQGKMDNWVFGCDVCQDVCPWNRFSKPRKEQDLLPRTGLLEMSRENWEEITEDVFNKLFEGSAVRRTKFSGLKRNIEAARVSDGKQDII